MEHIDEKGVAADELQWFAGGFFQGFAVFRQDQEVQEIACEEQEDPGQEGEIVRGEKGLGGKAETGGEVVAVKGLGEGDVEGEAVGVNGFEEEEGEEGEDGGGEGGVCGVG